MRRIIVALALVGATLGATLCAAATSAHAQRAVPDIKGTWTGKGKVAVLGSGDHHPGTQTPTDAARVRELETTHIVEGQDGPVAWGRSSSSVADKKEPFAWAIASDNKTIVGADLDGYFRITLLGRDRMEKCYVHNGLSPSRSVVASCVVMTRAKR